MVLGESREFARPCIPNNPPVYCFDAWPFDARMSRGCYDIQVRELLSAFGPLKSFHLVRDPGSPTSKGYGFCEYLNAGVTAIACEGLHGMTLGDKTLTVRPATDRG